MRSRRTIGKLGLSPLIATVLLVTFAIALGAVVMSWGEEFVEQKAEFVIGAQELGAGCAVAALGVITIKGVPQACYTADSIVIFVENGPSLGLDNILARVVGREGIVQKEILEQPLKPFGAIKTSFDFGEIGTPLQLKLIPKIRTGKGIADTIYCGDKAIIIEPLEACQ
ncbi:MAG: hypothetical protein QXU88_00620 [Candidatus Woesearchaeota archaeon]